MTHGNRSIVTVALVALLTPGLGTVARSQGSTATETPRKTFTISGTVGLPGVKFKSLPGDPVSDDQGRFSIEVPNDLNGYVMPIKEGYAFDPPFVAFGPTSRIDNVHFTARVITFKISGNVGLPGVRMNGLPQDVVTDEVGMYIASVNYGWSGIVTPKKPGFVFEPASRSCMRVTENLAQQDYIPRVITFTVSGQAGAPGVIMQGLPGEPVTDQDGNYRAQVEYGWSGAVAPCSEGLSFTPQERVYSAVTNDWNRENFKAEPQMLTISDVIAFGDEEPIQGIAVLAEPGGYSGITDSQGRYWVKVPYGWSGRLLLSHPDFEFDSDDRYTNVTTNMIDGTPVPSSLARPSVASTMQSTVPPPTGAGSVGDVLVIPTADMTPEKIAETTEDMRVMLHILQEKLSEPRMILGVLRDYGSFFDEGRTVEAFYLQGAAAVFVVQVDFPYSFPTQRPNEGEAQEEPADPVWERARQKLHSPAGARGLGAGSQAQQMTFDQFKDELLRSLKHAANLRNIDPNEQIILTVVAQNEGTAWSGSTVSGGSYSTGGWVAGGSVRASSSVFGYSGGAYSNSRARGGVAGRSPVGSLPPGTGSEPSTTVLTMQAKKADVDAFAKGELDFDQFRQRVRAFSY
ncbi:MAG: hypothetical protein ABFE13_06825 [Phycisphaerales bacterium]